MHSDQDLEILKHQVAGFYLLVYKLEQLLKKNGAAQSSVRDILDSAQLMANEICADSPKAFWPLNGEEARKIQQRVREKMTYILKEIPHELTQTAP